MIPKGGLGALMKQAQQMQENMRKAQEELAKTEVEGQSGAGLVKVTITCRFAVKKVAIDQSLLTEEKDMLEDLVMAAMNDAVAKAEAATQAKMAGFTAGLNLPPGMNLRGFWSREGKTGGPRGADPGAALPAGRGSEVRAAHGLSLAATRSPGSGTPLARTCGCGRSHPPLRPLQHVHRGGDVLALLVAPPRCVAALRGRISRRSPDDGADAELPGPVLRAHGPPFSARRHRPARDPPRSPRQASARRHREGSDPRHELHGRGRSD